MLKEQILSVINSSENFAEVRNSGILPDPDGDDGYYFISYSHADYKKVLTDVLEMQDDGVKIWYDRGLETGKSWISEVRKKISSYYCKGVIAYLSEKYFASQSCMKELIHVMEQNKPCVFIHLDGSSPAEEEAAEFISAFPQIPYEVEIRQKEELLSLLPKPQLFEFYFQKVARVGNCAIVTKLLDRNLQKVEIPQYAFANGKKYPVCGIAYYAFENCEFLEEVTVPEGWILIAENAFVNCPSLRKVNLGAPKKYALSRGGVLQHCFSGCENLQEISCPGGNLFLFGTFSHSEAITNADLPENFHIQRECFKACASLESATLKRLDFLEDGVFANCINLKSVTCADNFKPAFIGENAFFNCKELASFRIPDTVTEIKNSAFEDCGKLGEINIPEQISFIAPTAFSGCTSLKKVVCNAKNYNFLSNALGKFTLDGLFPSAEKFYLKEEPKTEIFGGKFIKADVENGYLTYVKAGEKNEL